MTLPKCPECGYPVYDGKCTSVSAHVVTTIMKDPSDKDFVDQFKGHRSGHVGDRLSFIMDWVTRHPACTLNSGEGAVLVAEIQRLRALLRDNA